MAWSVPHDFVPAEMVSHTIMNGVRDQLKETAPHKASAAGFPYASGANALAFAAFASNANKTLRANSSHNAVEAAGFPFRQAPITAELPLGNISWPAASAADILSASITTTGGKIVVMAYCWVTEVLTNLGGGPLIEHYITLRRDTTDLKTRTVEEHLDTQYTWTSSVGYCWVDSQSAGTYTYKVRGYYVNHNTDLTAQPNGPQAVAYIHLWEI